LKIVAGVVRRIIKAKAVNNPYRRLRYRYRVHSKVVVKVVAFSGSAGILPAGLHSPPVTSNGEAMIAMRAGYPRSKKSLILRQTLIGHHF